MAKNSVAPLTSIGFAFLFAALLFLTGACQTDQTSSPAIGSSNEPPAEAEKAKLINFAVFYGWPSSLNSADLGWDTTAVANYFKQYDLVVFGGGLEETGHGDHANLITIAGQMKGTTEVFGYIAMGNTDSHSVATIKLKIDYWKDRIDVDGIFIDEAGFDFKLAGASDADCRARQIEIINYIHASGLKAFMNAWDPDDLFVKESSAPISWATGDKYLYESYIFSTAGPLSFADYRTKIEKLHAAAESTGVEMLGLSTTTESVEDFEQADFDYLILSAIADGFDGVSWGTSSFSSIDAKMPFRNNTELFAEYEIDQNPIVDSSAQEISFEHESGRIVLDYQTQSYTIE